jgi:hypothetical protein
VRALLAEAETREVDGWCTMQRKRELRRELKRGLIRAGGGSGGHVLLLIGTNRGDDDAVCFCLSV